MKDLVTSILDDKVKHFEEFETNEVLRTSFSHSRRRVYQTLKVYLCVADSKSESLSLTCFFFIFKILHVTCSILEIKNSVAGRKK